VNRLPGDRAYLVVIGWGLGNAALMFILLGFGEYDAGLPVYLFASSNGIILIAGLTAWVVLRRHGTWAETTPALRRSTDALMVGLAAAFIGSGLVWRPWLMIGAFYPLVVLLAHLVDSLLSRGASPGPPPSESTVDDRLAPAAPAAAVVAASVAAGRWSARHDRRHDKGRGS